MTKKQEFFIYVAIAYMYIQLLLLLIVILIGIMTFKIFPFKPSIKKIALSSILVVISVLLNYLSIMIPLFGFPSFKIGFQTLSLILAGALLEPSYAYIVGLCVDIIGLIIVPTAFPFFGMTLNNILRVLIPSIWFYSFNKVNLHQMKKYIYIFLSILITCAALYIINVNNITVSKQIYFISPFLKFSIILFMLFILFVVYFLCKLTIRKLDSNQKCDFLKWISIVIIVEILVNICLTPLWIQFMYGIPWIASLLIRIIKAILMLPIDIVIGFWCYQLFLKTYK